MTGERKWRHSLADLPFAAGTSLAIISLFSSTVYFSFVSNWFKSWHFAQGNLLAFNHGAVSSCRQVQLIFMGFYHGLQAPRKTACW